jgi:hemolysin activation/secretion protein
MHIAILPALLLSASFLFSKQSPLYEESLDNRQTASRSQKGASESKAFKTDSSNCFGPLRGIVIASSKECFLPQGKLADFSGVCAIGVSQSQCLEKRLLPFCQSEPLCKDTLAEIKSEIEQCYRENGYPLILVEIPEQEVSSGVVQILVKE